MVEQTVILRIYSEGENLYHISINTPDQKIVVPSKKITFDQNILDKIKNYFEMYLILSGQILSPEKTEIQKKFGQKIDVLRSLGELIFSLFPEDFQAKFQGLSANNIIILTNELGIPWEFMYFNGDFLNIRFSVSKQIELPEEPKLISEPVQKKVKMLIIANPYNPKRQRIADLPFADDEANEIKNLIKVDPLIEIDILNQNNADFNTIREYLNKNVYQILHFAGHSHYNYKSPELTELVFYDKLVSGDKFVKKVGNLPKFIFINACDSANNPYNYEKTEEIIKSLARSFILNGIHFYLGNLWKVEDSYAKKFSIEFYKNLFKGYPIGLAIKEARNLIYQENMNSLTWPAITAYGNPSAIIENPTHEKFLNKIGYSFALYKPNNPYWNLKNVFIPPKNYDLMKDILDNEKIMLILGDPHLGKTFIAINLLFDYFVEGYEPQLIKVDENGQINIERLLQEKEEGKNIIYFEDPWGQIKYIPSENFTKNFQILQRFVKRTDSKIIITSRRGIFDMVENEFPKELRNKLIAEIKLNGGVNISYSKEKLREIYEKYVELFDVEWKDKPFRKELDEKVLDKLVAPHNIRFFVQRTKNLTELNKIIENLATSKDIVTELAKEMKKYDPHEQLFLLLVKRLNVRNIHAIEQFYNKNLKSLKDRFDIKAPMAAWESSMEKFEEIIEKYRPITTEYIRFGHPSYIEALELALEDKSASNNLYQVNKFLEEVFEGEDRMVLPEPNIDVNYDTGPLIEIDGFYQEPFLSISPNVIKISENEYRMFYTQLKRDGQTMLLHGKIMSCFSKDGVNWEKEDGIRIDTDSKYDFHYAFGPNVVKIDDNKYRMYYVGSDEKKYRILSAVSNDTITWEKEDGVRIGFDEKIVSVTSPHVVKLGDKFNIFYCGFDKFSYQIFQADSDDGLNWDNKRLIIPYGDELDFLGVHGPVFIEYPKGEYRIFYTGADGNSVYRLLSAKSTDLEKWEKEKGIRFEFKRDNRAYGVHTTSAVKLDNGKYRLYFQLYYQNTYSVHSSILNFEK